MTTVPDERDDNPGRVYLSFWRPISLLNVDYKIVAKSMANRLKKVMPSIVHVNQTCSVPGRSITDHCHLIRNVVDYTESRNFPCVLLSLDQKKAFDRVSHDFLFSTLVALGFGPSFIRWIKFLYADIGSQVLVNGFLTPFFPVTRGVRQGCPLSPLLYVLCIESFALAIRSDPFISGVKVPCSLNELKIVQYADDNNLFL